MFLLNTLINMLFPATCPNCNKNSICYPSICCPYCEATFLNMPAPKNYHTDNIDKIVSCKDYNILTRQYIKFLKYKKSPFCINLFSEIIKKNFREILNLDFDMIIPIPLHKRRLRQRGFNQSLIIAEIISSFTGFPVEKNILIKNKASSPQTSLAKNQRMNNLKNCFSVIAPEKTKGRSILLVDDVITTGTTLDSCAKKLLKCGVKKISGFTLARRI